MNQKLLRKKLALMLANLRKKRPYYCECEYLESTGTQYIDTGVIPTNTHGISINFSFSSNESFEGSWCPIGARTGDIRFWINKSVEGSGLTFGFGDFTTSRQTQPKNTLLRTSLNLYNNRKMIYVNGNYQENITSSISNLSNTLYLFGANVNGSISFVPPDCRIYKAQISEGSVLVRDFIPVLDWDMTPCMYDKVSGQLFYNAGTGDFSYGREIHPVEYLENTSGRWTDAGGGASTNFGSYINTGIHPKPNGKVKIGMMFNDWTGHTPYQAVFGGYDSNTKNFGVVLWMTSGTHKTYFMDGNQTETSYQNYAPNTYYDFEYDAAAKTFTTNGVSYTFSVSGLSSQSDLSIYLFTNNAVGSSMAQYNTTYTTMGKIYYFQYYEDDTLVGDFIPAIDENGVGFMFDAVTHTIFDNAGTGAFKYPPVELKYLEATGTQYIDTGYIPNQNTYVELNAMYTALDSTYRTPFSVRAYDGAANSFTIAGATNAANVYAFGSQYWSGDNGCPIAYTNTKYFMSLKAGVAIFNGVTGNAGNNITPTTLTAYMFARNANGTASNFFKGRIYNCLVKESSSIVRNFIPAYKDGAAGMLDKENDVFYANAGTGNFVVGKIVESLYE